MQHFNTSYLPHTIVKMIKRPIFIGKMIMLMAALPVSQLATAAECNYTIVNEWNGGFQAQISIVNNNSDAISDWELSWSWDGSATFNSGCRFLCLSRGISFLSS